MRRRDEPTSPNRSSPLTPEGDKLRRNRAAGSVWNDVPFLVFTALSLCGTGCFCQWRLEGARLHAQEIERANALREWVQYESDASSRASAQPFYGSEHLNEPVPGEAELTPAAAAAVVQQAAPATRQGVAESGGADAPASETEVGAAANTTSNSTLPRDVYMMLAYTHYKCSLYSEGTEDNSACTEASTTGLLNFTLNCTADGGTWAGCHRSIPGIGYKWANGSYGVEGYGNKLLNRVLKKGHGMVYNAIMTKGIKNPWRNKCAMMCTAEGFNENVCKALCSNRHGNKTVVVEDDAEPGEEEGAATEGAATEGGVTTHTVVKQVWVKLDERVATGLVTESAVLRAANGSQFYVTDGLGAGWSCMKTCLRDGFRHTMCDRACTPGYEHLDGRSGKEPVPFYIARNNVSALPSGEASERWAAWAAVRGAREEAGSCRFECMDQCIRICPVAVALAKCQGTCTPQCESHCAKAAKGGSGKRARG